MEAGIILQFAGSLMAILALAWLAGKLELGDRDPIRDHAHAAELAGETVHGFAPVETSVASDGQAAILRDAAGRVLVLRRHGAHFAGRLLSRRAAARMDGDTLVIDCAEPRFGTVELRLPGDASAWVEAIENIKTGNNA